MNTKQMDLWEDTFPRPYEAHVYFFKKILRTFQQNKTANLPCQIIFLCIPKQWSQYILGVLGVWQTVIYIGESLSCLECLDIQCQLISRAKPWWLSGRGCEPAWGAVRLHALWCQHAEQKGSSHGHPGMVSTEILGWLQHVVKLL